MHYEKFDILRRKARELIGSKREHNLVPGSETEILELINELRMHQVELEIQNDELSHAQKEIEELKKEYEELYEFAPCGYVTVNSRGFIRRANLTAVELLSLNKMNLQYGPFRRLLDPESQQEFLRFRQLAAETGQDRVTELRLKSENDPVRWVRADIRHARTKKGVVSEWQITLVDITGKKLMEDSLKKSLEQKETLLRELHHRTKNNMQVVASMIYLQSSGVKDPRTLEILGSLKNRIKAMALVHEKLYQTRNLSSLDLKDYVNDLLDLLIRSFQKSFEISLKRDLKPVKASIDVAIPCGLIMNELVSNAYKHAFSGRRNGTIFVSLEAVENQMVELCISDDGVGLPEELDIRNTTTLGFRSVISLAEHQLDGSVKVSVNKGTLVRVRFKNQASEEID